MKMKGVRIKHPAGRDPCGLFSYFIVLHSSGVVVMNVPSLVHSGTNGTHIGQRCLVMS